jgi:hypothetical protein
MVKVFLLLAVRMSIVASCLILLLCDLFSLQVRLGRVEDAFLNQLIGTGTVITYSGDSKPVCMHLIFFLYVDDTTASSLL